MRLLIGIILLLTQLRPVLGAGMCLGVAARAGEHCTAPMKDMSPPDNRSPQSPSDTCPLMTVCLPGSPVVPQAAVRLFDYPLQAAVPHSNPVALLTADPIAPPQPPPIV